MSFDNRQIRMFAQRIWNEDFQKGEALAYLTPRLRRALMAESVFAICRHQYSETMKIATMDELYLGVENALIAMTKNPNLFD